MRRGQLGVPIDQMHGHGRRQRLLPPTKRIEWAFAYHRFYSLWSFEGDHKILWFAGSVDQEAASVGGFFLFQSSRGVSARGLCLGHNNAARQTAPRKAPVKLTGGGQPPGRNKAQAPLRPEGARVNLILTTKIQPQIALVSGKCRYSKVLTTFSRHLHS
jgi:hypothetical protein